MAPLGPASMGVRLPRAHVTSQSPFEGPARSRDTPAAPPPPGPTQSPTFGKLTLAMCLLPEKNTKEAENFFYSKKGALDLFFFSCF